MKNNKKDYNTINNLSKFSYGLIVTESILMLLFAIFVRMDNNPSNDSLSTERMLGFLATNMMAVGFALFMSSGLYHQFTPITFSLLVVVLAWQMHTLMYALWQRILIGFSQYNISIDITLSTLVRASRCGLAAVLTLTAVLGRIGPKDILKYMPLFTFGYACTEAIVEIKIRASDPGGSIIIFPYACTFALVLSFILGKKVSPHSSVQENYRTISFATIGSFILWVCWPLFSCALYATTDFERTLIISNTLMSMAGSTISMTMMSAAYKEGISMLMMHRAALAGGASIGACSHVIYYPTFSILVGFFAGMTTFFTLRHLQGRFQMAWGLLDTNGVLSFGLFPSLTGTIICTIVMVSYQKNGVSDKIVNLSSPSGIFGSWQTLQRKGGYQSAALFVSVGMGVFISLISSFIIAVTYREKPGQFYSDGWHFDVQHPNKQETTIEYNIENGKTSTRLAPQSEQRFNTHETETQQVVSKKIKPKFKTRYGT